ncbi:unnamed protein product [Owenia fusiformis]|uniref:Uncharacterized protein n=1 Tax=Owenia fusiformis TaxID=6347 RepID=A0A8J1UCU8_OWEFU|nr:unnamed protein product [Owenia fusiformis]
MDSTDSNQLHKGHFNAVVTYESEMVKNPSHSDTIQCGINSPYLNMSHTNFDYQYSQLNHLIPSTTTVSNEAKEMPMQQYWQHPHMSNVINCRGNSKPECSIPGNKISGSVKSGNAIPENAISESAIPENAILGNAITESAMHRNGPSNMYQGHSGLRSDIYGNQQINYKVQTYDRDYVSPGIQQSNKQHLTQFGNVPHDECPIIKQDNERTLNQDNSMGIIKAQHLEHSNNVSHCYRSDNKQPSITLSPPYTVTYGAHLDTSLGTSRTPTSVPTQAPVTYTGIKNEPGLFKPKDFINSAHTCYDPNVPSYRNEGINHNYLSVNGPYNHYSHTGDTTKWCDSNKQPVHEQHVIVPSFNHFKMLQTESADLSKKQVTSDLVTKVSPSKRKPRSPAKPKPDLNIDPNFTIHSPLASYVLQEEHSNVIVEQFLRSEFTLCEALSKIAFKHPVAYIYNPLNYAIRTHVDFIQKYCTTEKQILLLGMNPGPWGMSQNGVPFGEGDIVRDWLKVTGSVGKPLREHPQRPIHGLDSTRKEVSGTRFWQLICELCINPQNFFANCFVHNMCPLAFMTHSGKNVTPPQLGKEQLASLNAACDEAICDIIRILNVKYVIGVGKFAEIRVKKALLSKGNMPTGLRVSSIMHPSPINPAANKGWVNIAKGQLEEMGLIHIITNGALCEMEPAETTPGI